MESKFDPNNFMSEPKEEDFFNLKKDDLISLADHLKLSVKKSWRKHQIRSVVVKHLVDLEVFHNSVLESVASPNDDVRKLELELEFKKLEMQEREKEWELQLTKQKLDYELEMKKLELGGKSVDSKKSENTSDNFDITKHIRLVPTFQEQEVDKYFLHFEKVAESLKWPKQYWAMLLQSVLIGKAREIYTQLSVEQASKYDNVKDLILKGYELVPEAYRQKFRNCTRESSQTFVEFARSKEQLFNSWCASQRVDKSYEKLRELVLIEEFKRCIHSDVRAFIGEQKAETLEAAARLADDYSLTHKVSFTGKPRQSFSYSPQNNATSPSHSTSGVRNFFQSKPNSTVDGSTPSSSQSSPSSKSRQERPEKPFKSITCHYCKKEGHVISDCSKLKRKESKPTGFVTSHSLSTGANGSDVCSLLSESNPYSKDKSNTVPNVVSKPEMKVFAPFIHNGFVSLSSDLSNATPIKVLRDTGASQSLVLSNTLPFSEESYTGLNVLIKGVDSVDYKSVPLHQVHLTSDLVSGPVKLGVKSSLPFDGVHLLLGNDLAGDKVVVNPLVTDKPCLDQFCESVVQEIPDLFPSCVVTRAMSKRNAHLEDSGVDFDLSDTFLGQSVQDECDYDVVNSSCFEGDSPDVDLFNGSTEMSKSNLILEQGKDPEISSLFLKAVEENELEQHPVCYYVKNGVLMRKWRPTDVCVEDEWAVKYQIVIPKSYRMEIMQIAHETPLAGHLGVNKTYQKILDNFYWPNLRKDVAEFCRSCHSCQVVGKPNQAIPKAPLQPIPAFEEPFSRIIIDCVGPLPKSKSGNQYLLTIMCAATRFPEAIPLRNIKTPTIVKALTKFFSTFGLPKSIQSDQGSNFMSGIFQQVMHELSIKQYKSSAYHPQSQGALERFHATLKNMLRVYCFETEKDWDEGVHLLLFAARESVQESLGFSPFELVFGHTVRGPLRHLKEKLLSNDTESLNLLKYVSDFRTKLTKACELAKSNLVSSQKSMEKNYNVKTKERKFKIGDKVLALLPINNSPLQARYFGPYVVEKKLSELNYVVTTPDRRKRSQLCHINMLKPYIERKSTDSLIHPISVNVSTEETDSMLDLEGSDSLGLPGSAKLTNSSILQNLDTKLGHLSSNQRNDVEKLLKDNIQLFSDVPTKTDQIYHDVDVNDATPVKQHPYRLSPKKQKYLEEEVQYLLDHDFIEPSSSSWSSPCLLVPKPDGTYRMCTDYRKVNNLSKPDTFPIPRMDDCIDKVGHSKYVTKFDLLKGFYQIPLTDRAKEISAFVTPKGLFQYQVMPFGMRNSPATFQRLINNVINGLKGCEAYIDDVIIYSNTWEEHIEYISNFFKAARKANLTINLAKSDFGCAYVTYLGHVVGQGQVKPVDAKISTIANFPRPEDKKQLMRFLGMAGYYRKFCPNFSTISDPLTQLLSKNTKFLWTDACEKAFDTLKAILRSAPVLSAPNFERPFKIAVDASDVASGAVLLQEDDQGVDHPICYFSKKFTKSQRNYATIEKECLAIILALQHFEVYVNSSSIVIYSDHNPLVFLHKLKNKNQRLLRWSLLLQSYTLDIQHIKGKDNLIADCLSRL